MASWKCAGCTTAYAVGAPACPQCGSTKRTVDSVGAVQVPALTVACTTTGCPHQGVVRRVVLTQVVPGVLAWPTLVCASCRAHLPTVTEENTMPKITVHGGPSDAHADERGEDVSPGTSSSTSSPTAERKSQSSENSSDASHQPAPTTGNRSKRARMGKPSARSTDGGQTAGTSAADEATA